MKGLAPTALLAATGLLLSGCLVSETPLLDASNATATPLAEGVYEACADPKEGEEEDCNPISVSLDKGGRYVFAVEDDVIETRFRQIGENDYAVQLDEGDGEGAQYFWGHAAGESFSLVMMWCSDLPRALVDSLIDAGGMATDDDYTTCEVKTVDALVAAAASYAAGEAVSDGGLTMTRAAAAE